MAEFLVSAKERVVREFRDISFTFNTNPFSADLVLKKNEDAVKQSIINLLRTNKYERPFHPEIYGGIDELLFDNYIPHITGPTLKKAITNIFDNFEPRAKLIDLKIGDDRIDANEITLTIVFQIVNMERPQTLNVKISRVR